MSNSPQLVQKLWNYCSILRDDGLSYGDYVEQLTFLLFLKMADEQSKPPFNKKSPIPKGKDWPALLAKDGDELEIHYRHVLEELGKCPGNAPWPLGVSLIFFFCLVGAIVGGMETPNTPAQVMFGFGRTVLFALAFTPAGNNGYVASGGFLRISRNGLLVGADEVLLAPSG